MRSLSLQTRGPHPAASLLLCIIVLVFALLLTIPTGAAAQVEGPGRLEVGDSLWEVRLRQGEAYVGRVVAVAGDTVTLETANGTRIEFTRAQVISAQPARGTLHGQVFWREDPNATRLFFSPTGRSLPENGGYLGVYELFIPFVAYGVTDRLALAGGSPFYLAFTGEITPPLYLGPKLQVMRSDRLAASVGAMGVIVPEDDETHHFGILYGVGTYGSPDYAVSAGAGWGYVGDEISSRPVVMVGGEARLGRFTKVLTENLFVPGEAGAILSAGVRFFGDHLAADAGLATLVGDDDTFWLPVVNFVYNFGP